LVYNGECVVVLAKRKSPTRCVEKYKNRKSNCVAVLQIAEKGCEYFLIVMKYLSKQYKYIYWFITIMNCSTPAEQVYLNIDLLKIILSYNRCTSCGCVGYRDKSKHHKRHFYNKFYDVFCLQQWKPITSICKLCLDHTQYYNDMIIFRNRNEIMLCGGRDKEHEKQLKWKKQKGDKRKILL
jgi:hypothetical protein